MCMTNYKTEEKLRKLASYDKSQAELGWLFYLSGEGREREEADELIDILLHQHLQKDFKEGIFLDPPEQSICDGEFNLGNVQYPPGETFGKFGLRENEWIKHLLIVGMTGAGKTNLAFQILLELKRHRKPFLVFDWKRNYQKLKNLPELSDLIVFTVARGEYPFIR